MTLPCIAAARCFTAARHLPFMIGSHAVGWLRQADVPLLRRWPGVFEFGSKAVRLASGLDTLEARSAALGDVIDGLAADGRIPGWRDETYAIRQSFEAPPLALIERAASRFFGTMTYAVHLNGIVAGPEPRAAAHAAGPRLWIAQRSATKAVDPGMLDNLVGGGIGWGYGIAETLAKECWEESGVPAALVARATRGRTVHVLQEIAEGTQAEQLFVFDLAVPADFVPANQDGEVAAHRLATLEEVRGWLAAGALTVDASLATLDALLRHGWFETTHARGFDALLTPPALLADSLCFNQE